jgi:hypothetical protein
MDEEQTMSEIVKGALPERKAKDGVLARQFDALVEAAGEEPGEWFSMPLPDGMNGNSAGTMIRNAVAAKFAAASVREGRAWVRINP